jgi:IS605 OrfB family transposase
MVKRTVTTKLYQPTQEKQQEYQRLQRLYADLLNDLIQKFEKQEFDHSVTTAAIDNELPSIIQNQAIRTAKSHHTEDGAVTFHTSHPVEINNQGWKLVETDNDTRLIGFTTTQGRLYCPIEDYEYIEPLLSKLVAGEADKSKLELYRRGDDWYVSFTAVYDEAEPATEETVIGVDLGLNNIVTVVQPDTDKKMMVSGKEVGYIRRKFHSLRQELQESGAQRARNRLGKKESDWTRDRNHKLAKDIVEFADRFENPVIHLEDLQTIREQRRSRKQNRELHSWAFGELRQYITYKAQEKGIDVKQVDPSYTSQRCYQCGEIEETVRDRNSFRCDSCGHSDHADMNAARNIAVRQPCTA